jgi:hypothetical protein
LRNSSALLTLSLIVSVSALAADDTKIVVGPNYLVSHDGDVPHCEMMVAANPLDARNLVASSIVAARPTGGWECRAYATRDGGATWLYSDFAEQVEFGGGDPQVVFTPSGTAIALSLTFGSVKDEKGEKRGGMGIHRSEDGGFTWKLVRNICCSHDHPQMVVDNSMGRYAGRIYVGTLHDYPVYRVSIFRSDDDGKTWTGPVEAANGGGKIGINVISTAILSDGTLIVPYVDFEFLPEKRKPHGKVENHMRLVSSSDGGLTFSQPVKTQTLVNDLDKRIAYGMPLTAADNRSQKYRDNLYMVWSDTSETPRLVFSRSTDRAQTWSKPVPVAADVPATAWQFQPTIAVNKRGVVGLTWLDTRGVTDQTKYDLYFAASLDGGLTFTKPVRITTASSTIAGNGNLRPMGAVFEIGDKGNLSLLSAANRWPNGGDYFSMAVNARDEFHPVWADARSGTFQVYTAPIRVELPPTEEEKTKAAALAVYYPPKKASDPSKRVEASLVGKVEVLFDQGSFDNNVVELPLHLRNKSDVDIYPPIRIEILDFGFAGEKPNREYDPEVLNATNGKKAAGAVFSFDQSFGDDGVLKPGMLSGPVPMRLKLVDPQRTPNIQFKIFGQVDKP